MLRGELKKIWTLFDGAERGRLIRMFVGILVLGVLEVAGVASIAPFLAVLTDPALVTSNSYLNAVYEGLSFTSDYDFLLAAGIASIVLLALSNSFMAFMNWQITYFAQMQGHRLSISLLSRYLAQPYVFFLNRNTTELAKNILSEVERVVNGVIMQGLRAITRMIIVVFIAILIFVINPEVAFTAAVVLTGLYWLIYKVVAKRLRYIGDEATSAIKDRFKIANEAISGVKELKLNGNAEEMVRRFNRPSADGAKYNAQSMLISLLPRYALEILVFGGVIVFAMFLLSRDHTGGEIVPIVALYGLAGYRLMPALQQSYQGLTTVRFNLPALSILEKEFSSLDAVSPDLAIEEVGRERLEVDREIRLSDISFLYPGEASLAVNHLNMTISSKNVVGIVGTTGSGKTTLIDILLGLLSPSEGLITADSVPVTEKNLGSWQKILGYVPQTIFLADDSIARNIAFAVPDDEIDMDRVIQSSRLAELDDFVGQLPAGYDAHIGDRGVRLSGGQRQRIGIARALYRMPKVLVLDEATSALDGATESTVMRAIKNLSDTMTIVMIAHRLATVRECDVIYVLEKGRIVGEGSYAELLSGNERFRALAQV